MTKDYFLSENPFAYKGHLHILNDRKLSLCRKDGLVEDTTNDYPDSWALYAVNNDNFFIFKQAYGRIQVSYGECETWQEREERQTMEAQRKGNRFV